MNDTKNVSTLGVKMGIDPNQPLARIMAIIKAANPVPPPIDHVEDKNPNESNLEVRRSVG